MARGEQAGNTQGEFEGLISAFPIVQHLLVAELDGAPVGLIVPDYRLLVVHPDARRRGIGGALAAASESELATTPDGPLTLFPPHGNAGAIAFLEAIGFHHDHSSWRLELGPGRYEPLPPLPEDIELAGYEAAEILPYVDLINTTFADHPTPLRVTLEQVEHVHAKPSFDPTAIAILRAADRRMVGFCTTGVDRHLEPPGGEIRMVGVLREYRGRGLGWYLLLWGIERLRSKGIETIHLSVDGKNENALALYRSVGFEPVEEWPQWVRGSASKPCRQSA